MPVTRHTKDAASTPTFVFKGTVKKLKSATMANVPVDNRTIVVAVDQIIEGPKNLAGFSGQSITVRLSGPQKVKPGQEMIFHTHSWLYGDSIAVQSVSQEAVKATHAALLSRGGDPAAHKAGRELQEHFADADLVVSGKVSAVRLPAGAVAGPARGARAAAGPVARGPVSEHDPKWREAVVEVDDVHKGHHAKKSIVIRFPASTDVRWYKAPKFHPGQQGYFMLHKEKVAQATPRAAAGAAGAKAVAPRMVSTEAYTALHPTDFQAYGEAGGIKTLIASKSGKGGA